MLQWIFDKATALGTSTGGFPLPHTLGSGFNLDTLIKEVAQKAYDQIKPASQGQIKCTFYQLHGADKEQFTEGLGWAELESQTRDQNTSGVMSARLKQPNY